LARGPAPTVRSCVTLTDGTVPVLNLLSKGALNYYYWGGVSLGEGATRTPGMRTLCSLPLRPRRPDAVLMTPRGAPTKSSRSRLAARMAKDAAHPFGNALEKSKCGRSERPTLEHTLPCSSSCVRTCASLRMFCCPRHLLLRVQGLADKAPPMSANIGGWLTAAGFTFLLFGVRSGELGALLGVLLGANLTSWPLPCTGWAMARRRPPL
jgi:hypothetical protein